MRMTFMLLVISLNVLFSFHPSSFPLRLFIHPDPTSPRHIIRCFPADIFPRASAGAPSPIHCQRVCPYRPNVSSWASARPLRKDKDSLHLPERPTILHHLKFIKLACKVSQTQWTSRNLIVVLLADLETTSHHSNHNHDDTKAETKLSLNFLQTFH